MDPIANMITQIKNAGFAGHGHVEFAYSKLKHAIADVLKKEGFIKEVELKTVKNKKVLALDLFSENRVPRIKGVQRISRPSKRIYKKFSEIRPVKNGYGALVISTPMGVMSGKDAKKQKVGGEALFNIW